MVINGEEELECEIHVDGVRLEHASKSYICVVFWTNQIQMRQNVVGKW